MRPLSFKVHHKGKARGRLIEQSPACKSVRAHHVESRLITQPREPSSTPQMVGTTALYWKAYTPQQVMDRPSNGLSDIAHDNLLPNTDSIPQPKRTTIRSNPRIHPVEFAQRNPSSSRNIITSITAHDSVPLLTLAGRPGLSRCRGWWPARGLRRRCRCSHGRGCRAHAAHWRAASL